MPNGKASVLSCIINLSSTCMGTGLLSLPFAFAQSGFTAGCILCVASACTCSLSLYQLVECGRKLGPRRVAVSLATVCEAALPKMGIVIDVVVIGNCLGTAASYFIVAADCFSALGMPRQLVVVLSVCVTAPPAFFRFVFSASAFLNFSAVQRLEGCAQYVCHSFWTRLLNEIISGTVKDEPS